ncbi:MAG TPA: hypothetical protein VIG72_00205 [Pontibacter sp.]
MRYSFIVTDQGRTGRDLSLRNYYHEKGYETIDKQTIGKQLLSKDFSLWVERL